MRRISISTLNFTLPLGRTALCLGAIWLVVIPAGLWIIATLYVPIAGPTLNRVDVWAMSLLLGLLVGVSLVCHALAHVWAARASGSHLPPSIPLYPLGDAAQVWPATSSAWREVLVAGAGPLISVLLAGLGYLIWNAQLNTYLNVTAVFFGFFNGGLAAINLTPAFPLDGGRLARAVVWGLLQRPAVTSRLGARLGLVISAALGGWGIFLIVQRARFSWETGTATLVFAGLILIPLKMQSVWEWDRPVPPNHPIVPGDFARGTIAGLIILGLLGVTFSLVPTNDGLEAPGIATSVEPMVEVAPQHRYPSAGSFILTTVIPQTPITAGEWVYGRFNPAIRIVPPERIVPPGTTPQELAQQGNQMLEESETIAVVEGLRLAGYDVPAEGKGAKVVSVLADSHAQGILQPGDVITSLNGTPIGTPSGLIDQLKTQDPHGTVHLRIERGNLKIEESVPLMPPAEANGPPRLGITVESAGLDFKLPFPAKIVPQKIAGGPSAGLMFTLTVYNMVTPKDLTGGRKIAGTGTIDLDGKVGPIGGVEQKVAAAEGAGAEYFLSPTENYTDAHRVARRIQVVKVATAEEAIKFLRSLPPVES